MRTDDRATGSEVVRIGLIAPPWVAVPPPVYGGTELVVDELARGLADAGHRVTLFTTGDSTCPVETRWVFPHALGTIDGPLDELGHVQAAYAELAGCDVIHDHTLLGPLWAATEVVAPPVVATAHGALVPPAARLYESAAGRGVSVVAISHDQARTAPAVPVARVIHHGIDTGAMPVGAGDGGYLLFLGRMDPDKGVPDAIEVARRTGRRLVIAAKMWAPDERQYFADVVEPLLGDGIEYVGEVGGAEKQRLLGGAVALVNPIRWPEPFGLVMIEALAAGTPVLAFPAGAAPEIVRHRRTGYLCADLDDMVRRVRTIERIDRRTCRADATERFDTSRMVVDHLQLYRELIARADPRPTGDGRASAHWPFGPRPARRLSAVHGGYAWRAGHEQGRRASA
jgi:glycosyltransferase involved in cell wall biosynthesis